MRSVVAIILVTIILSACATAKNLNQDLAMKNIALVKDDVFVPGLSNDHAYLISVVGQEIRSSWNTHEIPSGQRTLNVTCEFNVSSPNGKGPRLTGKHTLDVDLIAGHTYKLVPTQKGFDCVAMLRDETKP
jgi:hypothetical protein